MEKKQPIEHRRTLNVFMLAMLSMAVVVSLRNLPLSAEYGLSSLFFYVLAALFFMIPYALVSAELASGWPKAGGVYIWVREALGDRFGFFAIWMQWFHNMTWYPSMLAFVGAALAHFFNPELAANKTYLIAVILVGFWSITLINFFGIKTSALFSTLCVILGVIIPGALLIGFGAHWLFSGKPISIPLDIIPDLHFSNFVFLAGIFLALSGLEANANLAREVKNPKINYPRAIASAAILTIAILVFGSLAIAIVIPKEQISLVSGLLDAFQAFFLQYKLGFMVPVIAFFTIIGALGELNAWAIAGVKGLFVTTEHGNLPPFFHKLNKKHIPVHLLLFQAMLVTIFAFVFLYLPNINISYWLLSALSAQMYLLMYLLLFLSGIILKYKKEYVKREYQVPFKKKGMWVVSCVGILACLFALTVSFIPPFAMLTKGEIFRFEALLVVGFLISFFIPIGIYALRKPSWQIDVLQEIREEIHKNVR